MGLHKYRKSKQLRHCIRLALTLSMFAAGCKKKVPPATPPPPPPPPAKARRRNRKRRSSRRLKSSRRQLSAARRRRCAGPSPAQATDIAIEPGIGTVNASGSRQVFPGNTTTYTLTATGPGWQQLARRPP